MEVENVEMEEWAQSLANMDHRGFSNVVQFVGDIIKEGEPEVRYLVTALTALVLAAVHRWIIPGTTCRHVFSLVVGVYLSYFCFGLSAPIHFFVCGTVTYLSAAWLPHGVAHKVTFVFCLLYLAAGHFQRQYFHYMVQTLDWTIPHMMLTCKLTAFGYNYYDGHADDKQLTESQRLRKVKELPSLLEWYSYVYCFAGLITGPFLEFKEYKAFTDRSVFPKGQIPVWSSLRAALIRGMMVFVAVAINAVGAPHLPMSYVLTDAFLEHSFLYRFFYIVVSMEVGFCIWYFGWYLGEATCILMGMTYNGKDEKGNDRWDLSQMMNLWGFKLAQTGLLLPRLWNLCCSAWLRRYVFARARQSGLSSTQGMLATFCTSAIWHGFYPSYYLFFLSGASFDPVCRTMRRRCRHLVVREDGSPRLPAKYFYDFAGWFLTWTTINSFTFGFKQLGFHETIRVWSSIYFVQHIGAYLILLFFHLVYPEPRPDKSSIKKNEKKKQ